MSAAASAVDQCHFLHSNYRANLEIERSLWTGAFFWIKIKLGMAILGDSACKLSKMMFVVMPC